MRATLAREPVRQDSARESTGARTLFALPALDELRAPRAYLARHSRSFRFAAALLRGLERDRVERVYAWCRFTDDLVDSPAASEAQAESLLDAWTDFARGAYHGHTSGIELVDVAMREMAESQIPFTYALELARGVRSDLRFMQFRDLGELRVYMHRVAGVVGQWLTQLFGVRDIGLLERAAALGRAMQLTNILRDVGEDWDRGRLYIPRDVLRRHGVALSDIGAMRRGLRPVDDAYRSLVEELMMIASRDYAAAREAIPFLPPTFQRSVAVASALYEGIHEAIRQNGYDNLSRRAVTTTTRKVVLAAGALCSLARTSALPAAG